MNKIGCSLGLVGCFLSFNVFSSSLSPRLIVKWKKDSNTLKLSSGGTQFIRPARERMTFQNQDDLKATMEDLKADPNVEYVEMDRIMKASFNPNDSQYNSQWHYFESTGGVNLPVAWDLNRGAAITVAVVDTGITNHSDLNANVLPGADLIEDPAIANDGGGRDSDPSDVGDWIESGDACYRGFFEKSTWHGTHVAGTIAAVTNNSRGVAGVNGNAKILPVRVLGKCGGWASDIADGIRWAAGIPVAGVGTNPNPARVINLSLGGPGECGSDMQDAISSAIRAGAVVVVAAGNEGRNLNFSQVSPGNCSGVINVGANTRSGSRAGYSNFGNDIDVMAPGGDSFNPVLSTYNNGTRSPSSESYSGLTGTSMATPHVAGVASLVLSMNAGLYPLQVKDIIVQTAAPFTGFSGCTTAECGGGYVDAERALLLATTVIPDASFTGGETLSSGSNNGGARFGAFEEAGGGCGMITLGDDTTPPNSGGPMAILMAGLLFFMALGIKARSQKPLRDFLS